MEFRLVRRSLLCALAPMILLAGCGGGSEETTSPPITNPPATNNKPTVTIVDETASKVEKSAFVLKANASDSDGSIAKYEWSHDSSLALTVQNGDTANASFVVPDINSDVDITFSVKVTDDDGATETASTKVKVKRKVSTVTITGIITDEPIGLADITFSIGQSIFQAKANDQGQYSVELIVDESQVNQLLQVRAKGATDKHKAVEFISLMNSMEKLVQQAGVDGVLSSEDNFAVNVTNVTTAEYALLSRTASVIDSDEALDKALVSVPADEKIELAALIKIIVDNPDFALPEGVTSTLDLIDDEETAASFKKEVEEKDPTIIEKAKEDIKSDPKLVSGVKGSLVGSYIINSPQYHTNRAYHLELKADGVAQLYATDGAMGTWAVDNNKVTITLAANDPLIIDSYEGQEFIDGNPVNAVYRREVSALSFTVLQENEVFRTIDVTQTMTPFKNDVAEAPQTQSFITNLYNKAKTSSLGNELLGTWLLQSFNDASSDDEVFKITFEAGGKAYSDDNEQFTWSLNGTELTVGYTDEDLGAGTARFWFTKALGAGYQIVGLDTSFPNDWSNTTYGVFFKEQSNLVTTKEHIVGRWTGFIGRQQDRFDMNIDENFQVRIGAQLAGAQGVYENGIFYRRRYVEDGRVVKACDTTAANCSLSYEQKYNFVAIANGQYFILREETYRNEFDDITEQSANLFIYNYSNQPYNAFSKEMLISGATLYYKDANGEVQQLEIYPMDNGNYQIFFNGMEVEARLADGKLTYTLDNVSYTIGIVSNQGTEFNLCLYSAAQTCATGQQIKVNLEKPFINVTTVVEGNGQITPDSVSQAYGSSITLNVVAGENSVLKSVNGCNGRLENATQYVIDSLTRDCEVKAVFGNVLGKTYYTNLDNFKSNAIAVDLAPDQTGTVTLREGKATVTWVKENGLTILTPTEQFGLFVGFEGFPQVKLSRYLNSISLSDELNADHKAQVILNIDEYRDDVFSQTVANEYAYHKLEDSRFIGANADLLSGSWVLNSNQFEDFSYLEFKADGQVTVKEGERVTTTSWRATEFGFDIDFPQADGGGVAHVYLVQDLEFGLKALFHDMPLNTHHEVRAEVMYRRNEMPITAANFAGAHNYYNGLGEDKLWGQAQIYPNGEIRFLTRRSSAQGQFENDKYIRRAYYNINTRTQVDSCDTTLDWCALLTEVTYTKIGQFGDWVTFERPWVGRDDQDEIDFVTYSIFVAKIDPSGKVKQFHEAQIGFDGYELSDSGAVYWNVNTVDGINYSVKYDGVDAGTATLIEGKYRVEEQGLVYLFELLDNDQDGILVCKYLEGTSCQAQDQHRLLGSQAVPRYTVTVETDGNGQVFQGTKSNVMHGASLSWPIIPNAGYALSTISGCNGYVDGDNYKVDSVIADCTITASFIVPPPISQQVSFVDPVLAQCVDNMGYATPDKVTNIQCDGAVENIADLGYFPNLTALQMYNTKLSGTVSFANLPALQTLTVQQSNLSSVDVSANVDITFLDLSGNQLTSLDISTLTKLETLQVYNNALAALDLSKNAQLRNLNASVNKLTALDFSSNPLINTIWLDNNQLTSIDVSNLLELMTLGVGYNQISSIDLSKNTKLEGFYAYSNLLTLVDLSAQTQLRFVGLDNNQLSAIDVSNAVNLVSLSIGNNPIGSINLINNAKLEYFHAYNAQLTSLDVTGLPNLRALGASNNSLSEINISNNSDLKNLWLNNNRLTSIDVSQNSKLEHLSVPSNLLTAIDVSNLQELRFFQVGDNPIAALNLSNNKKLDFIQAAQMQLTTIDLSQNIELTQVDVGTNQLTSLDVANLSKLTALYGYSNQLTSLDVSSLSELTVLQINNNQLTTLDVGGLSKLTGLYVDNNKLTDVFNVEAIVDKAASLSFYNNPLSTSTVAYFDDLTNNQGYTNLNYSVASPRPLSVIEAPKPEAYLPSSLRCGEGEKSAGDSIQYQSCRSMH